MSRKKPTAMELKKVLESLIQTLEQMERNLASLNVLFLHYVEYQGESEKFAKYLQQKEKEYAKQEDISKSPSGK